MIRQILKTTEYLREKGFENPEIGIILGTGLGQLVNEIEIIKEVSYNHIPNFPTATVEFHKGKLIYGKLEGKKVIVMQGRFHVYEGYTLQDVTYPVRIMEKLGIKILLVSNAAGAINLNFKKGDLMLIEDHINLQGSSPLAFKGVSKLGERFPDMSEPYNKELNSRLKNIEKTNKTAEQQYGSNKNPFHAVILVAVILYKADNYKGCYRSKYYYYTSHCGSPCLGRVSPGTIDPYLLTHCFSPLEPY